MSDLILQYTSLPNLHPALVHLPLGLAPVALLLDLLAVSLRRARWLDRAGTALWVAAAIGAFVALEAGEEAADAMTDLAATVQPAIAEHSDWAHWALWAVAVLGLLRLALSWMERSSDRLGRVPVRVLLLVGALVCVGLLARTADLGGALVFQHGLGVTAAAGEAAPPAASPSPTEPTPADPAEHLVEAEDGTLTWTPLPADAAALETVIEAAPGSSLEALSALPPQAGEEGLGLGVDGRALLVLPAAAFGSVQVEARLALDGFEGTVGVAHHVAAADTAGLFTVSTAGEAVLANLAGGAREALDEAPFDLPEGPFTVAVSAAGRHLKGLVDGDQLTHGHKHPGAEGAAGLLLDGHGRVRLLSLRAIPLEEP